MFFSIRKQHEKIAFITDVDDTFLSYNDCEQYLDITQNVSEKNTIMPYSLTAFIDKINKCNKLFDRVVAIKNVLSDIDFFIATGRDSFALTQMLLSDNFHKIFKFPVITNNGNQIINTNATNKRMQKTENLTTTYHKILQYIYNNYSKQINGLKIMYTQELRIYTRDYTFAKLLTDNLQSLFKNVSFLLYAKDGCILCSHFNKSDSIKQHIINVYKYDYTIYIGDGKNDKFVDKACDLLFTYEYANSEMKNASNFIIKDTTDNANCFRYWIRFIECFRDALIA